MSFCHVPLSCAFLFYFEKSFSLSFQVTVLPAPLCLLSLWLFTPPWLFPPVPLTLCVYIVLVSPCPVPVRLLPWLDKPAYLLAWSTSIVLLQLLFIVISFPRKRDFVFFHSLVTLPSSVFLFSSLLLCLYPVIYLIFESSESELCIWVHASEFAPWQLEIKSHI